MRTNSWLAHRLDEITSRHFADVPIENTILVRFGRASRTRFGSIIARPHPRYARPVSLITINALFRDEEVPDYVIDATLAHEFVHYAHGFHSPLPQLYRFPHKGDIVNKELRKRGLGHLLDQEVAWARQQYPSFLRKHKRL